MATIKVDVQSLSNVNPLLSNARSQLESASSIVSSMPIPASFSNGGLLKSIAQQLKTAAQSLGDMKSWVGMVGSRFAQVESKNTAILDALLYSFDKKGDKSSKSTKFKNSKTTIKDLKGTRISGNNATVANSKRTRVTIAQEKFRKGLGNLGEQAKKTGADITSTGVNTAFGIMKFGEKGFKTLAYVTNKVLRPVSRMQSKNGGWGINAQGRRVYIPADPNWKEKNKSQEKELEKMIATDQVSKIEKKFWKTSLGKAVNANAHKPFKKTGKATNVAQGVGEILPEMAVGGALKAEKGAKVVWNFIASFGDTATTVSASNNKKIKGGKYATGVALYETVGEEAIGKAIGSRGATGKVLGAVWDLSSGSIEDTARSMIEDKKDLKTAVKENVDPVNMALDKSIGKASDTVIPTEGLNKKKKVLKKTLEATAKEEKEVVRSKAEKYVNSMKNVENTVNFHKIENKDKNEKLKKAQEAKATKINVNKTVSGNSTKTVSSNSIKSANR